MNIEALERLSDETLNELISADIDGELDAALDDLEIATPTAIVQRWFTTSERAIARYRALQAAADSFATSIDVGLDDVTKRRMIKTTLGRTPVSAPSRMQRLCFAAAAAAACVMVVVGVGVSLNRDPESGIAKANTISGDSSLTPQSAQESTAAKNQAMAQDLGVVTDLQQLKALADKLQTQRTLGSTIAPPDGGIEALDAITTTANCAPALRGAQETSALVIVAIAMIGDASVAVVTASDTQGRTLRWVYRRSDCAILFSDRS